MHDIMIASEQTKDDLDPSNYAAMKYSWTDLTEIINGRHFDRLKRSIQQERIYREYTNKLKRNWISIHDYILHSKFNYDIVTVPQNTRENLGCKNIEPDGISSDECTSEMRRIETPPLGCRLAATRPDNEASFVPERLIVKNDFPYYLEDEIEHWVLWKLGDLSESDVDWGIAQLRNKDTYKEILYWINPIHLKSLPDIDHAHIVCFAKRDVSFDE